MKKLTFSFLLFLVAMHTYNQPRWQNLADRYKDAYKSYLEEPDRVQEDGVQHFVYFARGRELIKDHLFLEIPRLEGAQIMYSWRQLEPRKGEYDFSVILEDLDYLEAHGKKLFIQLQDATFNCERVAVPDYLLTPEYEGGAVIMLNDENQAEGWVAKRWIPQVQERFARLLSALGAQLDGKIEGINLQESAASGSRESDETFTPEAYAIGVRANMSALKAAFSQSTTMQYANFMPGEWLPWEDEGYLRSLYDHGETIGVGLGAPDLMVERRGQLNHALALMHEGDFTVPLGIAVQDGNYIGETNSHRVKTERESLVPMLNGFARDFLKVNYMFWSFQEPYFTEDVIPYFN